ncbi:amidase [Grosmannia clavigera kw1407]|uniref:Amidase n=1 Tax=Grosmannia clavigera (strain kw1407 / UAMH 11150) TaxID=655863 RepID=F0XDY7_GROCL|nr:amidase [Grosmannia clavigera kw1407]EFX04357.1 amidase [Grosmannia clavigera kw1407]
MAAAEAQNGLSREGFDKIVASFGLTMKSDDADGYYKLMQELDDEVRTIEGLPDYVDPRLKPSEAVPLSGRKYHVPDKQDNRLNGWSHRGGQFELKDEAAVANGLLAGRSVAVKDTIAVAGVPLTLGTAPFHLCANAPYPIPTIDAPVISRVVAAGGVIKGTSTCENYCMSGLSFTSATGPVENAWLRGYSAGGSSSGSAALLAIGQVQAWREKRGLPVEDLGEGVDLALGGDQGGSIRLPAAYSGVYGLKPTRGLVPYTGIGALHPLADNVGPMATSLADVALLLSAIAGYDGLDPRCSPHTPLQRQDVPAYHEQLQAAIANRQARGLWTPSTAGRGLRVGLLREALQRPELDAGVAAVVRAAADRFAGLGATVVDVSAPLHAHGPAIWTVTMRDTAADVFIAGQAPDQLSLPIPGFAPPPPSQQWYDAMTTAAPTVVAGLFGSAYLGDRSRFPVRVRNKALAHAVQLAASYDALLSSEAGGVDVLLLPVTPSVGPRHSEMAGKSVLERYRAALGVSGNTAPFNVSGHPALSMPGGWATVEDGHGKLPVGLQIVGRHGDEVGVLLAASILEVAGLGLDIE